MNTQACAFHGANTLLQACLAQPGDEMFRCTSPGRRPIQYIVDRCPAGYDAWVCSTSFGRAVVPDVKYSNNVSVARVAPSGVNSPDPPYASRKLSHPSTGSPTAMRVMPSASSNLAAAAEVAMTCR